MLGACLAGTNVLKNFDTHQLPSFHTIFNYLYGNVDNFTPSFDTFFHLPFYRLLNTYKLFHLQCCCSENYCYGILSSFPRSNLKGKVLCIVNDTSGDELTIKGVF